MTKQEFIKKYQEIKEKFENLVVPTEETPKTIAAELTENYNSHKNYLTKAEEYAETQGFYKELVG